MKSAVEQQEQRERNVDVPMSMSSNTGHPQSGGSPPAIKAEATRFQSVETAQTTAYFDTQSESLAFTKPRSGSVEDGIQANGTQQEPSRASLRGSQHKPHALTHGENTGHTSHPITLVSRLASLHSNWNWLNWAWGIVFTALVPAMGSILWYGVIPLDSASGSIRDKCLWVFLINPVSMAFLSFLFVSLFFTALDEEAPSRPFFSYAHILGVVYLSQVLFPGLLVLFDKPFHMTGLVSIGVTITVTLLGIKWTPRGWLDDRLGAFDVCWKVFIKVAVTFCIFVALLAGYMIANASSDGAAQGFITVALAVIGFIVKKCLLQFADPINLETAMLIAGLWVENLGDVFVTLAFPTAEEPGPTFAIIFFVRIAENLAYLWFQLNIWFKFRIWIKGKFKKDQAVAIEEDLPEYADDRGHSAHHPGYRRRQLRFLTMKIFSQVSSFIYFMCVVPVLRYGPNNRVFPFAPRKGNEGGDLVDDTLLESDLQFLSRDQFTRAIGFAGAQIVSSLLSGAIIWWWMHHFHRDIIVTIRQQYNIVVIKSYHYGLVLSIMLMNSLIGTSFLQTYYRVYFV